MNAMRPAGRCFEIEQVRFGNGNVYRAPLFATGEVAQISAAVRDVPASLLVEAWNSPDSSMVTIGAPLYRNRDVPEHYTACARAQNRLLYRHFRLAHERVAGFFERRYGALVVFAEELAVPGFHVFTFPRAGEHGAGGWHVDMLHAQVPFFARHRAEVAGVVNFTVPFEVPAGGTGMDIEEDAPGSPQSGGGAHVWMPYEPGVMVFTEAEYRHRIGSSHCLRDGERRVTLQGHGVLFRGRWILFW